MLAINFNCLTYGWFATIPSRCKKTMALEVVPEKFPEDVNRLAQLYLVVTIAPAHNFHILVPL